MLDQFSNLRSILNDGSQFVTDLTSIMDGTAEIEQATFIAAQSTALLRNTLAQPGNMNPVPSVNSAQANLHKCVMCEQLQPLLTTAETELTNGVATALSNARAEVNTQMSSANRLTLRNSFDSSISPLTEAKDAVRDNTKFFLTDEFLGLKELILLAGSVGGTSVLFAVFGIGSCAALGAVCCLVRENSDSRSDEEKSQGPPPENPWNMFIAPCAGFTWCCGFNYAFWVFFISGIMIVAAVPFSSMCLIMDDISSSMLRDVAPGLGIDLNTSSNDFTMVADMIDTCFSRVTPVSNRSLMDIIFVEENGTQISIKAKIQGQTTDMINAQFANVDTMLNSGASALLMTNPNVVALLDFLLNPFDVAIVPEAQAGGPVLSDTTLNRVALDPRPTSSGLAIAFGSSLSCTDFVFNGQTVYGLNTLKTKLEAFTSSPTLATSPSGTCTNGDVLSKVVCNKNPLTNAAENCGVIPTPACLACESGNSWMDLKAELLSSTSYRCDIFQDANGNDCDVLNMQRASATSPWTNDCLQLGTNADGTTSMTMTTKAVTCDLPGFKTYMANWRTRLSNTYTRVDEAQASTRDGIQTSLRNLVDNYVTNPVNDMVARAQGSFLKVEYGDFVDALCYKSVLGFRIVARSYLANGIFSLFLILFSYGLWRHGIDNRNSYLDTKKISPEGGMEGVLPADGPKDAWNG
jgi:hypothetical protein